MPQLDRQLYEFGPFRFDPAEQQLVRDGTPISLRPKSAEILFALIQNSRHVMTKAELMSWGWPDTYVEEANLAQNISALRKALGVRPDGGQYIETISKRGYRFAVHVKKVQPSSTTSSTMIPTSHQSQRRQETSDPISLENKVEDYLAIVNVGKIRAGMRLGRYEIISLLGISVIGEVYLARDTQLERKVALKLLASKVIQNTQDLHRFICEAKAASALNHPNILTVYEICNIDDVYFIVAEFIEGKTLRQIISTERLDFATILEIAIQVANALIVAHASGITHCNIKPENIIVRSDGYVKVLDFGVAKLIKPQFLPAGLEKAMLPESGTDSNAIIYAPDYLSPEQMRGFAVDSRSDIFSLGVVLYEMITRGSPFAGQTEKDVLLNLLEQDPPLLSMVVPEAPVALEQLLTRLLSKQRELRIQTAEELQHELKLIKQEIESTAKSVSNTCVSTRTAPLGTFCQLPKVHYARSGDVNIAYQVIGDGPLDLIFVMGWVSHLEYFWAEPLFARFLSRLASFARLILFDKRGTGLSDRVPVNELPTLEQRMDDVRAVMDAVGSEQAVLAGVSEGGPMCSLFAATYPEKVTALIMIGTYAKRIWASDYPWAPTIDERARFFEEIRRNWGGPVGIEARAPSLANDPQFCKWWATYLRLGASPGAALALTKMNSEIDVRPVLPTIRVPTLVLHRTDDNCLKVQEGRYVASQIPGAKFVELPGADHLPFVGDQNAILDEIEEFLTGMRYSSARNTVLATVLVMRIAAFESQSVTFNRQQWADMLELHREHMRRELEIFKGREIELTNEKMIAIFDGPARAIRAACAINDSAQRLGIGIRVGLHTGECEVLGNDISGLAVQIGEEIAGQAAVGEVLVSSTVKDLVAGAGIRFTERGVPLLPQMLGEWMLFTVCR